VRKLILTATGLVCLTGASYFFGTAWGQNKRATSEDIPHKVALIDMGHVFTEYEKMKGLKDDLAAEFKDAELKAKGFVENMKKLQEELGQFKEGSAEHKAREAQIAKMTSEFQTFRQVAAKELDRKSAKAHLTIYQEVQDVIEQFCDYYHYTLVIRFSREELNSSDPQKLIQGLNRQVVYHRPTDDLTNGVIKYLNERYAKATQANPGNPVKPVNGTR
jgi:Skp family chaperone for outer membrane proteins